MNGRNATRRGGIGLLLAAAALGAASCGAGLREFPLEEPMRDDPDKQAFEGKPDDYSSPFYWDAVDHMIFRRISRFFAVERSEPAVNVNALGEVPDSSWYENRPLRRDLSPDDVARGHCPDERREERGPDPDTTWTVIGAKPDGANPGFLMETGSGVRYLLKFDNHRQPELASAADVIGSRLYWALGYHAPCNAITYFDRSVLRLGEDATAENAQGEEVPLREEHIDEVLAKAVRDADGRYRALASRFVEGMPLGPWRYAGTRDDDPNDVVPHQDRRELRGLYVLASWINNFDTREQNSLATWIRSGEEKGWIKHWFIDFGVSFGGLWAWDGVSRRLGHANYLDFEHIFREFVTLGIHERPWEDITYTSESSRLFGYFGAERFDPDDWKPGYPNPAFSNVRERDAAWMARKIARLSDAHVRAAVEEARFSRPEWEEELIDILIARRDRILERWLSRLAPLDRPRVVREDGEAKVCLTDVVRLPDGPEGIHRAYRIEAWDGRTEPVPMPYRDPGPLQVTEGSRVCVRLPELPRASRESPRYLLVDVHPMRVAELEPMPPARVHLYHLGGERYRVVGLERPLEDEPPEL